MQVMAIDREVVIEYERIQIIRKRAKTDLAACSGCGRSSDHIRLEAAVELFETTAEGLCDFVESNRCHHQLAATGTLLCLDSLLAVMRTRRVSPGKLSLGERK